MKIYYEGLYYYSDLFELTSNHNSNNMQKHANRHNSRFRLGLDWPIRNPSLSKSKVWLRFSIQNEPKLSVRHRLTTLNWHKFAPCLLNKLHMKMLWSFYWLSFIRQNQFIPQGEASYIPLGSQREDAINEVIKDQTYI